MNPAYQVLLQDFRTFLRRLQVGEELSVLDVGAGSGNFMMEVGSEFSDRVSVTHLDADGVMNNLAKAKYRKANLRATFVEENARVANFQADSFDMVVSVNALYAIPEPEIVLQSCFTWLKPGGYLYLVNLGRIQNTLEWTLYLVRNNVATLGWLRTLSILMNEGRTLSAANRRITRAQEKGTYWSHSTSELGTTLRRLGYVVTHLDTCYRGYSDIAICRRPTDTCASTLGDKLAPQ
jgi:ubiquinone/menaquinone biosynthesis C-methylase UbiE